MKHKPNFLNIKAAMKERKISQVALAKILKVHPVCVNEVVNGKRKNPRIRAAIAMAVNKQVNEIWP